MATKGGKYGPAGDIIIAAGEANFKPALRAAGSLGTRLVSREAASVGLTATPVAKAVTSTTSGILLDKVVDGVATPSLVLGHSLGTVLSGQAAGALNESALAVTRVNYTLTHRSYATGATSTGTWTTPANAIGVENGSSASNANTVTNAASGALTTTHPGQNPNRAPLTISSARLALYGTVTKGTISPATVQIQYSYGSGFFTLVANQGAFEGTVLIDMPLPTWDQVGQLQIRITFTAAASATPSTIAIDAVSLIVTASRTDVM